MFEKQFYKLSAVLFFLMMTAAFLLAIFANNAYGIHINAFLMLIGMAIYLYISFLFLKDRTKFTKKRLLVITLLLFLLQLFILSNIITSVGWDCGILLGGAKRDLHHVSHHINHYLSIYPNNLLLFLIERNLFRFFRHFTDSISGFAIMDVLNLLIIDLTIIVTALTGEKLLGRSYLLPCYYLAASMLAFFPWIMIPYSDTLGMLFPILALYCYLKGNEDASRKSILYWLLSGICFGIGYLLKPTALIPFIAIFCVQLFRSKSDFKRQLVSFLMQLVGIFCLCSLFSLYSSHQTDLQLNPEEKTPISHFLVLGSHYAIREDGEELFGTYNTKDVTDMLKHYSTKEKHDHSMNRYHDRLQQYGPIGYLNFLYHKFKWITGDGMFSWGIEGNFIKEGKPPVTATLPILQEFYYPHGKWLGILEFIFQSIWLCILLGCVIGGIKTANTTISILRLTCIGMILFLLLFEGRARYLIISLPFFILLAVYGYQTYLPKLKRAN